MFPRVVSILCAVLLLTGHAQAQDKLPAGSPRAAAPDTGSMIQAASDLRRASESLVQFGAMLEKLVPIMAEASVATSHEMAAMSEGFDPFGFKTSYQVIHEQNKMLQEQNELIRQLQQREIERLEREVERLRSRE